MRARAGRRRLSRGAGVVAALGAAMALSAPAAHAQEPPSTTAPAHPSPPPAQPSPPTTTPLAPGPEPDGIMGLAIPDWATGDMGDPCAPDPGGGGAGNASSVVPDDCWGPLPSSGYDIGFDEGAWNHIDRKVYGATTDMAFQASRSGTAMSLWMLEWAYGFEVYDRLGAGALSIADTYQRDLIGPLGLSELAWFYAMAWAGIAGLRGRLALAGGELIVSVLVAGLAGVLLANPAGYLDGTFDTLGQASAAVLATGTGQPPPTDGAAAAGVLDPLQAEIHRAFVEDPYDYLNWGGPLAPPCATMRDRIVANGPHGSSDDPRAAMALGAGCEDQVEFNGQPTGTRLFGAVLTMVAAWVMVVLVALVSLTVVVAQVLVVVLFALAPLALLAGVLPGGGRELAWRWVAALARAALAVVGMSFVLSLLLLTINALLEASADVGLVERFALVNMVVIAMLVARRRVLAAGHNLATGFGQRLASRRAGGGRATPWLAAPAVAGATGFALGSSLGPDRPTRSSRAAGSYWRNSQADRRMHRQGQASAARAQRRANTPTARERTEIVTDADGQPTARSAVTIDGPAATSRRARAARDRLERGTGRRHAAAQGRRGSPGTWDRVNPFHPPGEGTAAPVDDAAEDGGDGEAL